MSHVFISYAKEDTARARAIADALSTAGFTVFWDRQVRPGTTWSQAIGNALDTASCVIVLWSKFSVQSRWVREEAERAAARGRLLPALLEEVEPPFGFATIQAANLAAWRGDVRDTEFSNLLGAAAEMANIAPAAPPPPVPPEARAKPRPQLTFLWLGAGALALAAILYLSFGGLLDVQPQAGALPRGPNATAPAFAARGASEFEAGRYPESIADFSEALRLDPSNAEWYNSRGRAYSVQNLHKLALDDYNRAIERKTEAAYFSNRGYARAQLGQNQDALADYGRAIQIDPRYVLAWGNRAIVYEKLEDWQRAIADWTAAIQIQPSATSYNGRGYAWLKTGQLEEALVDLNKAIELDPAFQLAYENRADVYEKRKDWRLAIADWSSAMELKETRTQYERRAAAKAAIGDEAGASADRRRAARLSPPS